MYYEHHPPKECIQPILKLWEKRYMCTRLKDLCVLYYRRRRWMRTVRPAWFRHRASRRNGKRSCDQSMTTHTNHVSVCDSWALWQCYGLFTLETDLETNSKPDGYIVICRTFHIAQTQSRIPTPYFCIGQESESVPVSESGSVFKPLSGITTISVSFFAVLCGIVTKKKRKMMYQSKQSAELDRHDLQIYEVR